jgi:hypothetical protein
MFVSTAMYLAARGTATLDEAAILLWNCDASKAFLSPGFNVKFIALH